MALVTKNPTSNTTPDAGQGGSAVTSATNTGHGSTSVDAAGTQIKSCIWTAFGAVTGQITSVSLKMDWSENGATGGGTNNFRIQYSTNGGGAWTDIINHSDVTSLTNSSSSVSLSVTQDLTQVQVRDKLLAQTGSATLTASVSNIRIEALTVDTVVCVMM
jgi:hypothetical protein